MGVLPLQFKTGDSADNLGLLGTELFDVTGIAEGLRPRGTVNVCASASDGTKIDFEVIVRIDTPEELRYYQHGGILPYVLRNLVNGS